MNAELVEVVRSGFREGVHHGSVVVLGPDGAVRCAVGDIDVPVFPRSSNKPMQALGMLRAGLTLPNADGTDADLAISCASHSGEPGHVALIESILARFGLSEDDLGCPPDHPIHEPSRDRLIAEAVPMSAARRKLVMNCSGKHSAMLATCVQRDWPTGDYLDPGHPLQREIRAAVEELSGDPVSAVAVDGCGAPLFAITLRGLARAFARLVCGADGTPERRIADAMRAHPWLVSGTGREDEQVMTAVPGLLAKAGAEGVHAAALPDGGAVALKVTDGAQRARLPVLVGALRTLGVDTPDLAALAETPILGGGRPVGSARLIPGALG